MCCKVLITDRVHPILISGLIKEKYQVDYLPDISRENAMLAIQEYEGIVINSRMYMDRDAMDLASRLKFIARLGSGLEIIDLDHAQALNISVYNSPEGNCTAVAEHALGMILSLFNNLNRSDIEVRSMDWFREKNRGTELTGKTVGLIGCGHTGSAFAKLLRGFDLRILVYDKYKTNLSLTYPWLEDSSLSEVMEGSDLISLHVPLSEETHHLVSSTFLEKLRDGVIIVNTSRGAVVDTQALIAALEDGKVGGACLDVFENEKTFSWSEAEKVMYQRLYEREDVVLSPHIAGWTFESKEKLSKVLLGKISSSI